VVGGNYVRVGNTTGLCRDRWRARRHPDPPALRRVAGEAEYVANRFKAGRALLEPAGGRRRWQLFQSVPSPEKSSVTARGNGGLHPRRYAMGFGKLRWSLCQQDQASRPRMMLAAQALEALAVFFAVYLRQGSHGRPIRKSLLSWVVCFGTPARRAWTNRRERRAAGGTRGGRARPHQTSMDPNSRLSRPDAVGALWRIGRGARYHPALNSGGDPRILEQARHHCGTQRRARHPYRRAAVKDGPNAISSWGGGEAAAPQTSRSANISDSDCTFRKRDIGGSPNIPRRKLRGTDSRLEGTRRGHRHCCAPSKAYLYYWFPGTAGQRRQPLQPATLDDCRLRSRVDCKWGRHQVARPAPIQTRILFAALRGGKKRV